MKISFDTYVKTALKGTKLILIYFSAYCSESNSGPYYLKTEEGEVAHTYCHMENIPECGGGGWTLVMKIDGNKVGSNKIISLVSCLPC